MVDRTVIDIVDNNFMFGIVISFAENVLVTICFVNILLTIIIDCWMGDWSMATSEFKYVLSSMKVIS